MNARIAAIRLACFAILGAAASAQVAADRFFVSVRFIDVPVPPSNAGTVLEYGVDGQLVASHDLVPQLPPGVGASAWSQIRPCEVTPWNTVLCTTGYHPQGGWFELDPSGQVGAFYSSPGGAPNEARGSQAATVAPDGTVLGAHYDWSSGQSQLRAFDAAGSPVWSTAAEYALAPCITGDKILVGTFNSPGAATTPLAIYSLTGSSLGSIGAYRHVFVLKALPGNRVLVGNRPTDATTPTSLWGTTSWLILDVTDGTETPIDLTAFSPDSNWADVDDAGAIWILCGNEVVRVDPITAAVTDAITLQGLPPVVGLAVSGSPRTRQPLRWSGIAVAAPSARYAHAMAASGDESNVVLFGGWNGIGSSDETWLWDGGGWTPAQTVVRPPARTHTAMATDPIHGDVVLFGGDLGSGTNSDDTWTWADAAWTQRFPISSPPARSGHTVAWDASGSQVLMFGGETTGGAVLGDSWGWDGQTWTQLQPSNAPSPRSGACMAFDANRGRVVLFGGTTGSTPLGDTWEWNGATWLLVHPGGPFAPAPRNSAGFAYSPTLGGCVLVGGYGAGANMLHDTWRWNGVDWIPLEPSGSVPAHYGAALAAHPSLPHVTLFGGRTSWPGGSLIGSTSLLGRSASYTPFGSDCPGPGGLVPSLNPVGGQPPRIGMTSFLRVSNLPVAPAIALFTFGFSNTVADGPFGPYALPADLSAFGWNGCQQLVSLDILEWGFTTTGNLDHPLVLPYEPAWVGVQFFVQSMVFYATDDVAFTSGLDGVIGY